MTRAYQSWTCDTCGLEVFNAVDGFNVHVERGCFWCVHCAHCAPIECAGGVSRLTEFPARGKMLRNTLITEITEEPDRDDR